MTQENKTSKQAMAETAKTYIAPAIETIEVIVERGFAQSPPPKSPHETSFEFEDDEY
ncbi:hypothetical protein [Dysgonomonas sp. 511]|uniref:hypothetical protein n=1 Tax=Dysgonomonas sp. 511 TaxID=2302930 RepID=UPI0013D53F87|nr:hypothetical protein [Dysgonomonas sp. 511]